jgi:hypothetical protein
MTPLAWCPMCREYTVLEIGKPCAWCDTMLVKRRGGWKRSDRHARSLISTRHAKEIHAAHLRGTSLREISRRIYTQLGYATDGSCLEGIRAALDREGLAVRAQGTATAASGGHHPGHAHS